MEETEARLASAIDCYARAYEAADPEHGSTPVHVYGIFLETMGISLEQVRKELHLK